MKRALLSGAIALTLLSCKKAEKPVTIAPSSAIESYTAIAAAAIKDEWHLVYEGYSTLKRARIDSTIQMLVAIDSLANEHSPYVSLSRKDAYVSLMLQHEDRNKVQEQFGSFSKADTTLTGIELQVKSTDKTYLFTMVKEGTTWKINKVTAQ